MTAAPDKRGSNCPHYWLGWLSISMAQATKMSNPKPLLKRDLAEFLRSEAASDYLRREVREEMKR